MPIEIIQGHKICNFSMFNFVIKPISPGKYGGDW